jgi:NAD(P)-dependent dehydrogenase (short-subunit alcohol dehydrogenase family)
MSNHILITGVSKGIGLALARLFCEKGDRVTGTCRSGSILDFAHERLSVWPLDLADSGSIQRFVQQVMEQGLRFDMLINNAGIGPDLGEALPQAQHIADTFAVNVQGTVLLTEAMLPAIQKGGTILHISSKMGSIGCCGAYDSPAYRMSKAALNMYTRILANRLEGQYKVAALHPGSVKTTLGNQLLRGRLSPETSAAGIYSFLVSDFKQGVFWDVEGKDELIF